MSDTLQADLDKLNEMRTAEIKLRREAIDGLEQFYKKDYETACASIATAAFTNETNIAAIREGSYE